MAVVQKIDAILGVQRADWKKGLDAAGKDVKDFRQTATGVLNDLNDQFGKKSLLGKTMKLMAGGGAIAAVKMAVTEFKGMADGILNVSDAYRKGDITGGQMLAQMWRQIPVVGTLTEAMDSLRWAITGERAEVEKMEEDAKKMNASVKARQAIIAEEKKALQEWAKEIRKVRDEQTLLNTEPKNRPQVKSIIEQKNELADKFRKYQVDAKIIKDDGTPGKLTQTENLLRVSRAEIERSQKQRDAVMIERNRVVDEYNDYVKRNKGVGNDLFHSSTGRTIGSYDKQIGEMDQKLKKRRDALLPAEVHLTAMQSMAKKEYEAYQTWKKQYETNIQKEQAETAHKANVDKVKSVVLSWKNGYAAIQDAAKKFTEADKKAVHEAAVERKKEADKVRDAVKTPMDRYGEELKRLKGMYDAGDIDKATFGKAAKGAYGDLLKATAVNHQRLTAEELIFSHTVTASDMPDAMNQLNATAKAQLDALLKLVDQGKQPEQKGSGNILKTMALKVIGGF